MKTAPDARGSALGQTSRPEVVRLTQRADAYRLFSAAFCSPSDGWGDEELFPNLANLMAALHPQAGGLFRCLAAAHDGVDPGELLVEAARLFVGPFELAVPPYGSCYLDQGRCVMGDSTMAVQSFYRKWGLALASDANEIPDHIAVELEFMHVLLQRQARARCRGDTKEAEALRQAHREFSRRWLLPFAFALASRLKLEAQMPFYELLADALGLFLKAERDSMERTATT